MSGPAAGVSVGPVNDGPDPERVWRRLRGMVVEGLDGYRHQVVAETGLPFSRVRALRRLRAGELTHAGLAEAMMVDRPAASVVVDDLCARGLATRRPHPTDRRCKLVALTDAGHALLDRADAVVPPPPTGWAALTPAELAGLDRLLRRLTPPG